MKKTTNNKFGANFEYTQWASEKVFPKNVYQIRKTISEKLDSFDIKYKSECELFANLAILDFETISVKEQTFRDPSTTTGIGEHVPKSASIASNNVH